MRNQCPGVTSGLATKSEVVVPSHAVRPGDIVRVWGQPIHAGDANIRDVRVKKVLERTTEAAGQIELTRAYCVLPENANAEGLK